MKKIYYFVFVLSLVSAYTFETFAQTITSYGTGAGTLGDQSAYFGINAGSVNTGYANSFFGHLCGVNNTIGIHNAFFGRETGIINTSGSFNTFLGSFNGIENTTGGWNTFVGYHAGNENDTGDANTFIGANSGASSVVGSYNSYFGYTSFPKNKGSRNTAVGFRTGNENISGEGNLFLGYKAGYSELGSNKLYISNSETSTPLIYGEFDNSKLVLNGGVGIGVDTFPTHVGGSALTNYKLFVKGGILAEEVRVRTGWADYVFDKNYTLKPLEEVADYIVKNGRLPNVPSATNVEAEGLNIGDIIRIQQEKIEELTLYIIEQNKVMSQYREEQVLQSKTIAELMAHVKGSLKKN